MELEETTEETSLMNKKPDDLTVGESLKIQVGAAAVTLGLMVAIPVAIGAAFTGYEKLADRVRARKAAREAAKRDRLGE